MQLSKILKTSSEHFAQLMQSTSKFKHLEKQDNRHCVCILEVSHCQQLAAVNMLNSAKDLRNLNESTFIKFL